MQTHHSVDLSLLTEMMRARLTQMARFVTANMLIADSSTNLSALTKPSTPLPVQQFVTIKSSTRYPSPATSPLCAQPYTTREAHVPITAIAAVNRVGRECERERENGLEYCISWLVGDAKARKGQQYGCVRQPTFSKLRLSSRRCVDVCNRIICRRVPFDPNVSVWHLPPSCAQ